MLAAEFEVMPVGTRKKLETLAALRAEIQALRQQLALANLAMQFTDQDIEAIRTVVIGIARELERNRESKL